MIVAVPGVVVGLLAGGLMPWCIAVLGVVTAVVLQLQFLDELANERIAASQGDPPDIEIIP